MKPLSPTDQSFLWLERRQQPMHVGGLQLLRYPEDAPRNWLYHEIARFRDTPANRPPFNQRVVTRLGQAFWEEDDHFDIENHFFHTSLPRPGRIRELLAYVSKMHGTLLDRAYPLWEFHLIEGLKNNQFAVYTKLHHAMVDGVAAMQLARKSLSEDPAVRDTPPLWAMSVPKKPRSKRARAGNLVSNAVEAVQGIGGEAQTLAPVLLEVAKTLRNKASNPDFVSIFQAPRCILNQRITGSRRFAAQSYSLDRIKQVAKSYKATINDIVLAMCAHALRAYLQDLNELPDDPLIAMVPMSLRQDESASGNQVGVLLANLGTHIADPVKRLEVIRRSILDGKRRIEGMSPKETLYYQSIMNAPAGLKVALGILPEYQAFNLVISNVPGPRNRLYWNGAELVGMYPVSIPIDGMALNITLTSYCDKMEVGLTACRRTLPSMQRLLKYLEDSLVELEKAGQ